MSAVKKIVVGITGKTKSGKSEACRALSRAGYKVIDVDKFAHGLYLKGMPLWKKLVKLYGERILDSEAEIDRKILREIAFSDRPSYTKFTLLVYPALNKALKSEIRIQNSELVILDMAVLFESGFYRTVDAIVFVKPGEKAWKKRMKTLKDSDYFSKAAAFQADFSSSKKIALSDHILYNKSSKAELGKRAGEILQIISNKKGKHGSGKKGKYRQNS